MPVSFPATSVAGWLGKVRGEQGSPGTGQRPKAVSRKHDGSFPLHIYMYHIHNNCTTHSVCIFEVRSCPLCRVLEVVLSGESSECVPVYSRRADKLAHRSASLAALAKIWDHYGFRSKSALITSLFFTCIHAFHDTLFTCRHMSQLYSQLQGHMMSCDPPPMELEGRESCVLSVSTIAKHLLNTV